MDPSSVFERVVDERTHQYRSGLFLGMWDAANGEYAPHPCAFPLVQPMSPAEIEGYCDAVDDSDEPRDGSWYPLVHLADKPADGLSIMCDSDERVFLFNTHIRHVDCPDCQAAYDASRETPGHFDQQETTVS